MPFFFLFFLFFPFFSVKCKCISLYQLFKRKIRTHLDLLSIPRFEGENCQNVVVSVLTSVQFLLFLALQGKETNFLGHRLTQNKVQKNKIN